MNEKEEKVEISIFDGEKIEKEDLEALKGDNVGETVYSAKWTLNLLQKLSKVEEDGFSKDLEDALTTLWDMTAEKEVAEYLVENDFLKIAEFTLNTSQEPRLTEIVVGILGNLSCEASILSTIGKQNELVSSILRLLSTDDAETLIQILRVLRAAIWDIGRDVNSLWIGKLRDSTILREVLPFVLTSSTNEDLLVSTIGFLRSCLDVDSPLENASCSFLEDLLEPSRLVPGLVECFSEIFPEETDLSSTKLEFLQEFLSLLRVACANSSSWVEDEDKKTLQRVFELLSKTLNAFEDFWSERFDSASAACVHECVETVLGFRGQGLSADGEVLDGRILGILFRVAKGLEENLEDPEEAMSELQKYLASYWTEIARISTCEYLLKTVGTLEKDIAQYSIEVLRSSKKISSEKFDEISKSLDDK